MRYHARVDGNQGPIVQAIRACGGSWADTHAVGNGCVDGFSGWFGRYTIPCEIKSDKGTLTEDEEDFHKAWRGTPIEILRSQEDVIRLRDRLVLQMAREEGR